MWFIFSIRLKGFGGRNRISGELEIDVGLWSKVWESCELVYRSCVTVTQGAISCATSEIGKKTMESCTHISTYTFCGKNAAVFCCKLLPFGSVIDLSQEKAKDQHQCSIKAINEEVVGFALSKLIDYIRRFFFS